MPGYKNTQTNPSAKKKKPKKNTRTKATGKTSQIKMTGMAGKTQEAMMKRKALLDSI